MARFILFTCLLFLVVSVFAQNTENLKFYVGTFTSEGAEGIYFCDFDTESGNISLEKTFKAVDNPSFLRLSRDKEFLYAVSRTTPEVEKTGGFAISYKVQKNGGLKFLNKQISNGSGPCHIDVSPDGKYVAIATYGGGTTSLYPVANDGKLKPVATLIENTGSGPNKTRQEKPHAHSIKFSPFDNRVFSADLGTDQLNIYLLEDGKLQSSAQQFAKMPPGAGPRHFEFHPGGKVIYVINELNSTISALKYENSVWEVFQNVSTLPEGFEGNSFCADIHISADGKYLYGSNRGHNSIAVFEVNEKDQSLKFKTTVSVEGNWPRNFSLSPDGGWMLVANQKSHDITVFRINKENGVPEFSGKKIGLSAPVCIEFL